MATVFALKIFCDICFYFTFANLILFFFGGTSVFYTLPVFAVTLFLCGLSQKSTVLRSAFLGILIINLSIVPSVLEKLLLFPPMFYACYSVYTIEDFTGRFEYYKTFSMFIKMFIPFFLFSFATTEQGREECFLSFALVFFVGSVVLMRMLRHEPEAFQSNRFKAISVVSVFLTVAAGALLSSGTALGFYKFVLSFLYFKIIAPFLMMAIMGILFIIWPLFSFFDLGPMPQVSLQPTTTEFGDTEMEMTLMAAGNLEFFKVLFVLSALALAAYLSIKLFRRLRGEALGLRGRGIIERRISLTKEEETFKRRPISQIREIYQKYMIVCQKAGFVREAATTSLDFEEFTKRKLRQGEVSADLRDIYINARYGGKAADVKKAREIYNFCKGAFKRGE